MKLGKITDNNIGKNPLNLDMIRKKYFQFQERNLLLQEHNLLAVWSLADATALFRRTFGSERITIQRLSPVSCKKCRGTEPNRTAYSSGSVQL